MEIFLNSNIHLNCSTAVFSRELLFPTNIALVKLFCPIYRTKSTSSLQPTHVENSYSLADSDSAQFEYSTIQIEPSLNTGLSG